MEFKMSTQTAPRMVVRRALPYVRMFKAREIAYREACADWARQGYRPAHCIHGVNMWTDYDAICGYCEDGPFDPYALALDAARSDVTELRRRTDWISTAPNTLPREMRDTLIDWALEPVTNAVPAE